MDKGEIDNKILLIGIVITILIAGLLFFKNVGRRTLEAVPVENSDKTNQSQELNEFLPEPTVEEGLYLEIDNPIDGTTVNSQTVNIIGKTEANAEVFINDSELKSDTVGNFSYNSTLEEGDNVIVITVSDDEGNFAEKTITILYEPAE